MEIEEILKQLAQGGITVQGDFVMEKKVEYEVNNVEAGGTGIQVVNGKEVMPMPTKATEEGTPAQSEKVADSITPSCPVHRGPQHKYLFALNGKDTEENVAVRNREKEHLLAYLRQHKLSGKSINATQGDVMNSIVISFLLVWMKQGNVSPNFCGTAVWRFLKNDCGFQMKATEKAYGNKILPWVKHKLCDAETRAQVEEFMNLHKHINY